MSSKKLPNRPTTLIVHGANNVGEKLIELLSTQKTNIIVADEFTRQNKDLIKRIKNNYDIKTYDISAIKNIQKDIKRIDYIYILLDRYLVSFDEINSKKFLSETNTIDEVFKLALKKNSKVLLTSTIDLHRKISSHKADNTHKLSEVSKKNLYSMVELQKYAENLAAEYHDQGAMNIRIARLGNIIGEGMRLDLHNTFVEMIKEAVTKPRIQIKGEGLDYSYYVHILDAVYGLIKALFSNKTNGEVFSLSYPKEISSLNLAYRILEKNPNAEEIEFKESDEDEPQQIYVPAQNLSKLGWKPKIEFEQALVESLQYAYDQYGKTWENDPTKEDLDKNKDKSKPKKQPKHSSEKVTPFGEIVLAASKPFKKLGERISSTFYKIKGAKLTRQQIVKISIWGVISLVFYIFILSPVFQALIGGGLTYYYGKKAYTQASQLNIVSAQKELEKTSKYSDLMNNGIRRLKWLSVIPGLDTYYSDLASISSSTDHLVDGAYFMAKGAEPYTSYIKEFQPITNFEQELGGGSQEYTEYLEAMEEEREYIDRADVELSLASETLRNIDISKYPESIESRLQFLVDKTNETQRSVDDLNDFKDFIPNLLGKDGRKTYVILFQNPMELRSTGGWLTSYAVVGIERGQVREMRVNDVYEADGRLEQTVEPPESMQNALDLDEWNLSLSNWSPDYPESAEAAEYFLKLEDEIVEADGVIAVDLEYVRNLIDVWGEIEVPGETEPTTSDNIYDKVVEIHRNFTPGSTNKPVYLSNLANQIVQKLLGSDKSKWPEIAKTTAENLEEKHLLIYLDDIDAQQYIEDNNWGGKLETSTNMIYPVEWNNGGNKANHFLDRSMHVESNIVDENTIQQKLTISYKNRSTEDRYPEGPYENYIRVYLPSNIELTRISGIDQTSISRTSTDSMSVVSGWVEVPIQSNYEISISYKMSRNNIADFPIVNEAGGDISYKLNLVKQPGIESIPVTLEISYPGEWEPKDLNEVQRELDKLIHRDDIEKDKMFTQTWER